VSTGPTMHTPADRPPSGQPTSVKSMGPAAGRWQAWLWRAGVLALLALVFLAYIQPSLMQHLAEQLWACF